MDTSNTYTLKELNADKFIAANVRRYTHQMIKGEFFGPLNNDIAVNTAIKIIEAKTGQTYIVPSSNVFGAFGQMVTEQDATQDVALQALRAQITG